MGRSAVSIKYAVRSRAAITTHIAGQIWTDFNTGEFCIAHGFLKSDQSTYVPLQQLISAVIIECFPSLIREKSAWCERALGCRALRNWRASTKQENYPSFPCRRSFMRASIKFGKPAILPRWPEK